MLRVNFWIFHFYAIIIAHKHIQFAVFEFWSAINGKKVKNLSDNFFCIYYKCLRAKFNHNWWKKEKAFLWKGLSFKVKIYWSKPPIIVPRFRLPTFNYLENLIWHKLDGYWIILETRKDGSITFVEMNEKLVYPLTP